MSTPNFLPPIFPGVGPLAQAREAVRNSLLTASRKLNQAIKNRDNNGPLPPDVYKAFTRFFRGSGLEKLDLLKTRIDTAAQWIQKIPFDPVPKPVPPGYRDEKAHRFLESKNADAEAMQPPPSGVSAGDIYIAIYPDWYAVGSLQAPILVHELFHFFPDVHHSPSDLWKNALAYQGFVGTLGWLTEGPKVTAMFPP